MTIISTFAQISNYQITAVEMNPVQNKNDLLSIALKPFSIGDYAKIEKILIRKIEKLDDNVVEVAKFMQKLDNNINWRSGRLKKINYSKSANPRVLENFFLKNQERINNKQDPSALTELLALAEPQLRAELITAWNEVSVENSLQVKLYYTAMNKIKNQLQKNITAQPDNCQPNQAFFSRTLLSALTAKDFSVISPDYVDKDFLEYKKTLFYLSRQSTPEETLSLTYLYINSSIDYYHNDSWKSTAELIKTKRGDCSEQASLYYTALKMQGIVAPELWVFIDLDNKGSFNHGYGLFFYKGDYYIYDGSDIRIGKDHEEAIRSTLTIKNFILIKEANPEKFLLN